MVAIIPDDPIDDSIDDTSPRFWARAWEYILLLLEMSGQDTSDGGIGQDTTDGGV